MIECFRQFLDHLFFTHDGNEILFPENGDVTVMRLLCQGTSPCGLGVNLPALRSGHGADDDPVDTGQIYRARIIEERLEGYVIMSGFYIFPQRVDAPELCFSGNCDAKPGIVQVGAEIQQVGTLAEEEELVLGVLADLRKDRLTPFRFPARQVAHARQQEVLRAGLVHQSQLARKELRL